MSIYRTRPAPVQYVKAMLDEDGVVVQACDRNGKTTGRITHLVRDDFDAKYEPARSPRKTKIEPGVPVLK